MANTDEQNIAPHVCSIFESQTWRKSLCKNCFHTLEEHSEELLAKEAEGVAKEKAAARTSTSGVKKPAVTNTKNASSVDAKNVKRTRSAKETDTEKEKSPKHVKGKVGVNKDSSKEDGKVSLTKDVGREHKATRPGTIAKTTTEKHSAISTTTSSVLSPTVSPAKSPLKHVKPSTAAAATATAAQTTATNSITPAASGTTSASNSQKTSISKGNNAASTFEPKPSMLSKDKLQKPPDTTTRSSSILTNNNKCTSNSPDSKLSHKSVDQPQSPLPKGDPKSPRKLAEETKLTDVAQRNSKAGPSKVTATKPVEGKNDNGCSDNSKIVKTSLLASKPESKDAKLVNGSRSKTPLFSKDSLKNVKDSTKQTKSSQDSGENKTNSPQNKDDGITNSRDSPKDSTNITTEKVKVIPGSKYSAAKVNEIKAKQQEHESALKSSTKLKSPETNLVSKTDENKNASTSSNHETAELNKAGHLVKVTTKSSESNALVNTENKEIPKLSKGGVSSKRESSPFSSPSKTEADKGVNSKDRGKEKAAGITSERKHEPATDCSVAGKKALPSFCTIQASRSATPSSIDTKSSSLSLSTKAAENKSKNVKLDTGKEPKSLTSSLDKSTLPDKLKDKPSDKGASISSIKASTVPSTPTPKKKDESKETDKEDTTRKQLVKVKDAAKLTTELKDKEEKLEAVTERLSKMEKQVNALEDERDQLKGAVSNNQKRDTETMLNGVREQLSNLESQCLTLEKNNQSLIAQLHVQEAIVKQDQESNGKDLNNVNLEEDLEAAEKELEDVKEVNKDLQTQIMEMKCEMDEMYDHFRESEHEEFRELQKELDMTAKNCRILQFKLRKSERRNEQFEEDRIHYEDKLRMLQDKFDSKDAKNHIRILEEELRIAKEVSVRLHDELDIVEDKRNKALDDNRHLTDLLEHTDRRQFRLEMEIDKLRDIVAELKLQLTDAKSRHSDNNNYNTELSPEKKVLSSIYTRSID